MSAMKRAMSYNEQVEISSDDSSSYDADNDASGSNLPNGEPSIELSPEEWLLRRAKSYQDYMKLIPIPTERGTVIPYNTWTGIGRSIKQIYGQPLHYLTNVHLQRLDQQRSGAEDESDPLEFTIHPVKAENTIWLLEEVHRLTTSPQHLFELWKADPMYHAFTDAIFPKLAP